MYEYIERDGSRTIGFQSGEDMFTYLARTEYRDPPAGWLANTLLGAGGSLVLAGAADAITHSHIADKIPYMSDPRAIVLGSIAAIASFVAAAGHIA